MRGISIVCTVLFFGLASCQDQCCGNQCDQQQQCTIYALCNYPEQQQNPEVSDCGPCPCIEPIQTLCEVVQPPQDSSPFLLPCPPIPKVRVVATKCCCTKTVVKPQIFQRTITATKNQRFVKRTFVPVQECIPFIARPTCSNNCQVNNNNNCRQSCC